MFIGGGASALPSAAACPYRVNKLAPPDPQTTITGSSMDLTSYSSAAPEQPLNLLFIHHSVGGQLLADAGPAEPTGAAGEARLSIHRTHPNGGGLRTSLESQRYLVHEASYSSIIGQKTDLFDWLPKFRAQMPRILATGHQDQLLAQARNHVVLFKSCFPNSAFKPDRADTGNPAGPALTLPNARATLRAVRDELAKHPDVLFVYLTAPPLLARSTSEPQWKRAAKKLLGRTTRDVEQVAAAAGARTFNNWVKSPDGWLKGYSHRNIVVFDYFDLLTGEGKSNFLQFPSEGGRDDHPSAEGQQRVTAALVPFLNRAVRYAGITDHPVRQGSALSQP